MTLKYTEEYLKLFDKYQEDIVWTLRQQEKLRLEYIMFLKKDLPEILLRQKIKRNPFNKKIYEESVKLAEGEHSVKIEKFGYKTQQKNIYVFTKKLNLTDTN